MEKLDPVQKLTMKLGAVCEGEESSTILASLVALFACLTGPVDEKTFKASVEFFNEKVGEVRENIIKASKDEEKPQ